MIENKHVYKSKDCIKKFCESLREVINFEKKKLEIVIINRQSALIIC